MLRIVFISALWFGALACFLLGILSLRRRPSLSGLLVTLLLWSVGVFAFGYGLELSSQRLPNILLAISLEYAGLVNITPLWLLLALIYTGRIQQLRLRQVITLWLVPMIVLAAVVTNSLHHLYYHTTAVNVSGPYPAFEFTRGPLYWLHVSYTYSLSIVVTILLIRQYRMPHILFRKQVTIMLVANLFTLTISILHLLGVEPVPGMDMIPFSMILSSAMLGWGILNYRLIELTPVARDALFERLIDAVIVLDPHNRLVDFNLSASRAYHLTTVRLGEKPADFLPEPIPAVLANLPADGVPVEVDMLDAGRHTLEIYRVEIMSRANTAAGQILVLHDTTRLTEAMRAFENANLELGQTLNELSSFNHAMIGREIRMIELKNEINELRAQLGIPERYKIPEA